MRINSSKSIAALMAVCVGTLSSVTAMAAPIVTTYTTYDIAAENASANVDVVTKVEGASANSQVTFLVAKPNVTTGNDIVFIDQQKANAEGAVDFTFSAPQNKMYADNLTVNVKLGTNGSENSFPTFTFTEGANYYGTGNPAVAVKTADDAGYADADALATLTGVTASDSKVYWGKLSGNASGKSYGLTIDNVNYRAYGCGYDGTFCIVLNGDGATSAGVATAYVE